MKGSGKAVEAEGQGKAAEGQGKVVQRHQIELGRRAQPSRPFVVQARPNQRRRQLRRASSRPGRRAVGGGGGDAELSWEREDALPSCDWLEGNLVGMGGGMMAVAVVVVVVAEVVVVRDGDATGDGMGERWSGGMRCVWGGEGLQQNNMTGYGGQRPPPGRAQPAPPP